MRKKDPAAEPLRSVLALKSEALFDLCASTEPFGDTGGIRQT